MSKHLDGGTQHLEEREPIDLSETIWTSSGVGKTWLDVQLDIWITLINLNQ